MKIDAKKMAEKRLKLKNSFREKHLINLKQIEQGLNPVQKVDAFVNYYNKCSLGEQTIVLQIFQDMDKQIHEELYQFHKG